MVVTCFSVETATLHYQVTERKQENETKFLESEMYYQNTNIKNTQLAFYN